MLRVDNAFGDGLFMEQLSASLGDRAADLLIKMDLPIVTTETIKDQAQKPTVQFKLFDSKSNLTFNEVTYFITIEKNDKTLLWYNTISSLFLRTGYSVHNISTSHRQYLVTYKKLNKYMPWIHRISVALLMVMGVLLLTGYLGIITSSLTGTFPMLG